MMKPRTDDANAIQLYKAHRKEISARYYQRHRKVIKLAMTGTGGGNTRYALIFQGNVTGAHVIGNKMIGDQSQVPDTMFAFYEKGHRNIGNLFQNNQIPSFFDSSLQGNDCVFGNTIPTGAPLPKLRNSQSTACAP